MKKKCDFLPVPQVSQNCTGKTCTEGKAKTPHQNLGSSHAKIETLGPSPSFGGCCFAPLGRHFTPAQALQIKGLVVKLNLGWWKMSQDSQFWPSTFWVDPAFQCDPILQTRCSQSSTSNINQNPSDSSNKLRRLFFSNKILIADWYTKILAESFEPASSKKKNNYFLN
jgi:hypothetical protein